MQITLSFNEIMTLTALIFGAGWAILKLVAVQFARSIKVKFDQIEADIKDQSTSFENSMDSKLLGMLSTTQDKIQLERTQVALMAAERHALYLEKFSTKDELVAITTKNDAVIKDIFDYLRKIEEKFSRTVSKDDCNSCRGIQQ